MSQLTSTQIRLRRLCAEYRDIARQKQAQLDTQRTSRAQAQRTAWACLGCEATIHTGALCVNCYGLIADACEAQAEALDVEKPKREVRRSMMLPERDK